MLAVTIRAETIPFDESFDVRDGAPPGVWETLEGVAQVETGRVRLLSRGENVRLYLRRTFSGDVSVTVRLLNGTRSHWSGIVVHDVYHLIVNNEFQILQLRKRPPRGLPQELGTFEGYRGVVWNPDDMVLRLDVVGGILRAYLDGKRVIEARDPEPVTEGSISFLGGYRTDIAFDDISVRDWSPELEPIAPPPLTIPSLPEFRAQVERPDAVYYDGETVFVDVTWRATETESLRVRYELLDFDERVVARMGSETATRVGSLVRETAVFRPTCRGVFKVRLTVTDEAGRDRPQGDIASFAVLPAELEARPANAASRFGGHPHAESADYHNDLARKIGMRWARSHDAIQYTWWTTVQPERTTWQWFDAEIAALRRRGLELLGEFLYVPSWASSAKAIEDERVRMTSPPRDLADFYRYVYETVRHYRDVIRVWEVWNEPHFHGFWLGTAGEYARLLRVAYEAAKRADPTCIVVGGGGINLKEKDWTLDAFNAGLLKYCDVVSFHYSDIRRDDDLERFAEDIAWLREQMRNAGEVKPLWNTEEGIFTTSFLDAYRQGYSESNAVYHFREAAYQLVKTYVGNFANGIEKVFYYDLLRPSREPFIEDAMRHPLRPNLIEIGGSLKPVGVAHATTATWLDGASFGEAFRFGESGRAFVFARDSERVIVAWSGEPLTVSATGSWRVVDVMGNVGAAGSSLYVDRAPRFYVVAGDGSDSAVEAFRQRLVNR
jgi:hypothetical protein